MKRLLLIALLTFSVNTAHAIRFSTTVFQGGMLPGATCILNLMDGTGSTAKNNIVGGFDGTITGASWVVGSTDSFRYPIPDTMLSCPNTSGNYIDIPASNFANVVDFTYMFWVKRSSQNTDDSVMGFDNTVLSRRMECNVEWYANGKSRLSCYLTDGVNTQYFAAGGKNIWGGWHFIQMFSSGTGKLGLQVDDEPEVTISSNTLTFANIYVGALHNFRIGQLGNTAGSNPFGGFIAKAYLYNKYIPRAERLFYFFNRRPQGVGD